jgi:hypothetical protein
MLCRHLIGLCIGLSHGGRATGEDQRQYKDETRAHGADRGCDIAPFALKDTPADRSATARPARSLMNITAWLSF